MSSNVNNPEMPKDESSLPKSSTPSVAMVAALQRSDAVTSEFNRLVAEAKHRGLPLNDLIPVH